MFNRSWLKMGVKSVNNFGCLLVLGLALTGCRGMELNSERFPVDTNKPLTCTDPASCVEPTPVPRPPATPTPTPRPPTPTPAPTATPTPPPTATPTPPVDGVNCFASPLEPLTPTQRGPVKFFTGHYVAISGGMNSSNLDDTLAEVKSIPIVTGVQKRYAWAELEVGKDDYRFQRLQDDLDAAQAKGKKLAIMIMYKFQNTLPDYLATLENGDYRYIIGGDGTGPYAKGELAKFENAWVVDRFLKFMKELKRFDSHPALAAVIFPETAMGLDMSTVNAAGYYEGIKRIDRVSACLFRATPVFQMTNFPFSYLETLITNEIKYGNGLGAADVMPADTSLTKDKAVYWWFNIANPTIPLSTIVAGSNYRFNSHTDFKNGVENGLSAEASVMRLGTYAVNTLHSNYIWWKRDYAGDKYYLALLEALKNNTLPIPDSMCPSAYICK